MKSITQLPKIVQDYYQSVKTAVSSKFSDNADAVAWGIVKQKFTRQEDLYLARSEDFNIYKRVTYNFKADEASISRSEDGFSFIDYYLLSTDYHKDGLRFSPMAVDALLSQINEEGLVGRIESDHAEWNSMVKRGSSPEDIERALQSLDTGIKAIKALRDGNKIRATLQVRNDLVDKVLAMPGASVEARFPQASFLDNTIHQARYQGFVLTDNPADGNAVRVNG